MLAALACVDYVVIFDETSVAALVERVLPDVLVKSAQYAAGEVVGHEIVAGPRRPRRGRADEAALLDDPADREDSQPSRREAECRMNFPTTVGIFLPNWVGDLVMATPTLRAMRRHFGRDSRLVGIVRPHLTELLAGTDWLDESWPFDPRAADPTLRRRALVCRLRRERFDLIVLLTHSFDTALLAWLGGAMLRVGYARHGRSWLLTDRLRSLRRNGRVAPWPMVQTYLALAEAVGCPVESPRLELAVTEAESQVAEQIWNRLGLRTDGRVIALNSSGAYGAAKLWPAEHFAELARRVTDELDHDVLVICGPLGAGHRPRDRPPGRSAAGVLVGRCSRLAWRRARRCLRRSRLMVSTDSGPRHVAAALGKPVITILGPTVARRGSRTRPSGESFCQPRSRLSRLRQTGLPVGASSVHARPAGRVGLRRGRGAVGGGTTGDGRMREVADQRLVEGGCHCWPAQQCVREVPGHTAGQAGSGTRNP